MECVTQASIAVRANDFIVAECASRGTLQINEFMPLLALALLESIDLLKNAALTLAPHIEGITASPDRCRAFVEDSPALMTTLLPHVGYERAQLLMNDFKAAKKKDPALTIRSFLSGILGDTLVADVLSDNNLVGLGHVDDKKGTL
jgi:aspartate ammonia-lyase